MKRFRWLLAPFLRRVTHAWAQSEESGQRLQALGLPQERIQVAGNLKFDHNPVADPDRLRTEFQERWGIPLDSPIWIAGCTHDGEETVLGAVHGKLRKRWPNLVLILAPRHVERAAEVVGVLRSHDLKVRRYSEGAPDSEADSPEVLLVDVTGELSRLYSCADVAFVGGIFRLAHTGFPTDYWVLAAAVGALDVLSGIGILRRRAWWRSCGLTLLGIPLILLPVAVVMWAIMRTPPEFDAFGFSIEGPLLYSLFAVRWLVAAWQYRTLTRPQALLHFNGA